MLDASTGQLEFAVLMRAFAFEKALMQEHFNENYVESNKYPTTLFKDKIRNIDSINFGQDGKYTLQVEGTLTIKGVTQPIQTQGFLLVKGGELQGTAEFMLKLADYNIRIPALVRNNIAEEIRVNVHMLYQPLTKK